MKLTLMLMSAICFTNSAFAAHASSSSSSGESVSVVEEPFFEFCHRTFDLNNFPDPSFLPLAEMGIKTPEEFKAFWFKETGCIIVNFSSFTAPISSEIKNSREVVKKEKK